MPGGRYGIRITTQQFHTGEEDIGYSDQRFRTYHEAEEYASGLSYGDSDEYHEFEAVDLVTEGEIEEDEVDEHEEDEEEEEGEF